MDRRTFFRATAALSSTIAAGAGVSWLLSEQNASPPQPGQEPAPSPMKRIICIGDSWTTGNQDGTGVTYPALLAEAAPGMIVLNEGRAGWTSTEIATRWGAPIIMEGFELAPHAAVRSPISVIDPSGTFRTRTTIRYSWAGEIRSEESESIRGTLHRDGSSPNWYEGWSFERTQTGRAIKVMAGSQFVCTEMDEYRHDLLVIAMGRNNYKHPADVVRDVGAILNSHQGHDPCIVLGVSPSVAETRETVAHASVAETNRALRSSFPEFFTDLGNFTIDRGLSVTNSIPEQRDLDAVSRETVPPALMISAGDHPNANGYRAIATCVLDELVRRNVLLTPPKELPNVNPNARGTMVWSADNIPAQLGAQVSTVMDRAGHARLQAPSPFAAPTLHQDQRTGKRFLSFDGTDDRMFGLTDGDVPQPFTVIARIRFRDLTGYSQGILWSYDSPGATLSATTSGRLVLNAGSNLATSAGTIAEGEVATIASVVDDSTSYVGRLGTSLEAGEAGSRGILTQFHIGYFFDTGPRYAKMDLFELRLYPWALDADQIAGIARGME